MADVKGQGDPREIIENALWTAEGEAAIEEYEVRTALRWLDGRETEVAALRGQVAMLREALDETLHAYLCTVRHHERDDYWPHPGDLSAGAEIVFGARVLLDATDPVVRENGSNKSHGGGGGDLRKVE
jgi:hypothetical protein